MRETVKDLNSTQKGKTAELRAARFLSALGYEIIVSNFTWLRRSNQKQGGEIDLVCLDLRKKELIFVEVRSSKKPSTYLFSSIGRQKQKRLLQSITVFRNKAKTFRAWPYRFDIVWVESEQIHHWKNVELASFF